MGLLDSLLRAERKIQKRIDQLFGTGASATPLELRRDILDEVENCLAGAGRGKLLPFSGITVRLQPGDDHMKEVLRAAFLDDQALEKDIRQLLDGSHSQVPETFEIDVRIEDAPAQGEAGRSRTFHIEYSRVKQPARARRKHLPPQVEFVVVKGVAEQDVYLTDKPKIHLGRLKEVMDKEGQMARRNDIVFVDNGEEINSTVGRAHATIYFDDDRNEFRIIDEVSKYGTRIFRDSRSIEVPPGASRGVRLSFGDEVYLGRACVRFDLPKEN